MPYYIVVFIISLWATNLANKCYRNRKAYLFFSFFAVVPPILLAGLRAPSVGSDTEQYIEEVFNLACMADSFEAFRERREDIEFIYMLLNYVISRFTNNAIYIQTVAHIFVILPVYKAAMLWRKDISPMYLMLFFYCISYQESLSTVRQAIAMSITLLAFTYFIRKEYKKYIIWSAIAFGFHVTAFIPLLFPVLYFITTKYPIKKYLFKYIFLISFSIYIIGNLESYLVILLSSGLIPVKYAIYSSTYSDFSQGLGITNVVVKILTLIYFTYIVLRSVNDKLLTLFFFIAALDLLLSLAGSVLSPLQRLAYYPRIITCISIPYVFTKFPIYFILNRQRKKIPIALFFSILLIFFWYYVYMQGDMDSTYAYTFA